MYRLIRLLFLVRLFYLPGKGTVFYQIFTWSKQQKLFRLAEAALYALAKVDKIKTTAICQECISLPLKSKILAIASIHILKNLDWEVMKQSVLKLLENTEEPYILLNLIDALSTMSIPFDYELRKSLLSRFVLEQDLEIISRISSLIGEKADTEIFDDLILAFEKVNTEKKRYILSMMQQIVDRKGVLKDLGLTEFLYKVLRQQEERCMVLASVLLYRLEDDYSIKVIDQLFRSVGTKAKVEIIRELKGILREDFIPLLNKIILEKYAPLQQALRETVLQVDDETFKKKIIELVLKIREGSFVDGYFPGPNELLVEEFSDNKVAYKFEKEHIVKVAVMFTDVVNYSGKVQRLSSMELTRMINEYEGMLFPIVSSHHGELIKKMGDGHLFIFDEPLNAVLAGVRIQKSLKSYNSFREEKFKITIRIGIHWGDVVRKGEDIYGNTVNIASRLEKIAVGGTVYISGALHEKVKKYILTREIGPVQVKGIIDPILVYEPYEVAINQLAEKDPLNRKQIRIEYNKDDKLKKSIKGLSKNENTEQILEKYNPSFSEHSENSRNNIPYNKEVIFYSRKLLIYLQHTFSSINKLCSQLENGKITLLDVKRELEKKWHDIVCTIPKILNEQ